VVEDISERKRAEERLMYLAQFDALTGLPNRSLLRDRLGLAIARAKRNDQMVGVMFLDLDNFSEVNDLLGHAAGDRVLQTAAALLSASLREVDTLGRLGGDEFTIVLENITGEDQVSTVAEKIKKVFAEPIVVDGREIFVSASVGSALYPHGGETVDALLQSADVAMYHAKGQGRNIHAFASPTMTAEASERFQMVALLRRAMERQEFRLHYQPIVDLKSRGIIGAEALIRLDSPEHGLISPAKFIPLAEGTGLIVPIGEWVLKTACLEAMKWQVQGRPPVLVSVNLSARQLRTKGLLEMIATTLSETGLAPELLKLEITESHVMEDGHEVMDTLTAIRQLGVGLAMDDFGTGYSSLGNLAKLPVQALKIDRSFIARMLDDSDAMALVSTILTLARSLRLKVVAEGVETEQQEKALRLLRCDEMQGYIFSRPLPAAEFSALLARNRRTAEGEGASSQDVSVRAVAV
jgi:diguanylate cyclase (GGDEF)-like protein